MGIEIYTSVDEDEKRDSVQLDRKAKANFHFDPKQISIGIKRFTYFPFAEKKDRIWRLHDLSGGMESDSGAYLAGAMCKGGGSRRGRERKGASHSEEKKKEQENVRILGRHSA